MTVRDEAEHPKLDANGMPTGRLARFGDRMLIVTDGGIVNPKRRRTTSLASTSSTAGKLPTITAQRLAI
jgi:hypothetical protein